MHMGSGTRALLGPRAPASRRRALRGAAQGGADVVSRFPLLAPEARCGALRALGLKAISFWVGACGTRGHGPPAHWLSLRVLRAPQRASGASSGKRETTSVPPWAAPRSARRRRSARSEQSSCACPPRASGLTPRPSPSRGEGRPRGQVIVSMILRVIQRDQRSWMRAAVVGTSSLHYSQSFQQLRGSTTPRIARCGLNPDFFLRH